MSESNNNPENFMNPNIWVCEIGSEQPSVGNFFKNWHAYTTMGYRSAPDDRPCVPQVAQETPELAIQLWWDNLMREEGATRPEVHTREGVYKLPLTDGRIFLLDVDSFSVPEALDGTEAAISLTVSFDYGKDVKPSVTSKGFIVGVGDAFKVADLKLIDPAAEEKVRHDPKSSQSLRMSYDRRWTAPLLKDFMTISSTLIEDRRAAKKQILADLAQSAESWNIDRIVQNTGLSREFVEESLKAPYPDSFAESVLKSNGELREAAAEFLRKHSEMIPAMELRDGALHIWPNADLREFDVVIHAKGGTTTLVRAVIDPSLPLTDK